MPILDLLLVVICQILGRCFLCDSYLTVGISTTNSNILGLRLPDYNEKVCYVIIHQIYDTGFDDSVFFDHSFLSLVSRKDVLIKTSYDRGLSKSRNLVLECSQSRYLYIMDDDVVFNLDRMLLVCDRMGEKGVQVGTSKVVDDAGQPFKKYPADEYVHSIFSLAKVSSIEICLDLNFIKSKSITFDQDFGLGAIYPSGEEYVFLSEVLRKGGELLYVPLETSIHPIESSGKDFFSSKNKILAKRNMIIKVFPKSYPLFMFLFLLKKIPVLFRKSKVLYFSKFFIFGSKS